MIAFREAIAATCLAAYCECPNDGSTDPESLAEATAILAMPEMQAIRKVLQRVAEFGIAVCDTDALMADFYDMPDAIHDWVDVGTA